MNVWPYDVGFKVWVGFFWSTFLIMLCAVSLTLQVLRARKARRWVAVMAKVEELNDAWWAREGLTRQPRFKSITIQYSYDFGESHYIGTNVTLNDALSIISYDKDLHMALQLAKDHGKSISIWVNPDEPSESVINRNISLADIILGTIIIVFVIFAWLAWFIIRGLAP